MSHQQMLLHVSGCYSISFDTMHILSLKSPSRRTRAPCYNYTKMNHLHQQQHTDFCLIVHWAHYQQRTPAPSSAIAQKIPAVSFIMMTSLWCHLWTLNMATLPLKSTENEHWTVFFSSKKTHCTPIHSEMHPAYMTSVLRSEQYNFGVRKCWMGRNLHQIVRWSHSFLNRSQHHFFCIGHSEGCW